MIHPHLKSEAIEANNTDERGHLSHSRPPIFSQSVETNVSGEHFAFILRAKKQANQATSIKRGSLACSSILKTQLTYSSETSVDFQRTMRRYIRKS
jgi:hypothetical protein